MQRTEIPTISLVLRTETQVESVSRAVDMGDQWDLVNWVVEGPRDKGGVNGAKTERRSSKNHLNSIYGHDGKGARYNICVTGA